MAAVSVKNENIRSQNNTRRRRKKRRTEDFSSDSDSSSDSAPEEDAEKDKVTTEVTKTQTIIADNNINIDDVDILSDDEAKKDLIPESLSSDTFKKLSNIKLTATNLPNVSMQGNKKNILNSRETKEAIYKDRNQLNNEYLKLMASSFGDDLDELRKKPDFTDKSLVLLAKTLQSGSNMFDEETLNVIFSK